MGRKESGALIHVPRKDQEYAIEVGLDPDETVRQYTELSEAAASTAAREVRQAEITDDDRAFLERQRQAGIWLRVIVTVVLVAIAASLMIPLLGWMMRMSHDILLRRGDKRSIITAMRDSRDRLDHHLSVMIFPEGTRSRDGYLYKGRTGAARLALKVGCPIFPVGIVGTREIQPPDASLPVLVISQFTLYADTRRGRRPTWEAAAPRPGFRRSRARTCSGSTPRVPTRCSARRTWCCHRNMPWCRGSQPPSSGARSRP